MTLWRQGWGAEQPHFMSQTVSEVDTAGEGGYSGNSFADGTIVQTGGAMVGGLNVERGFGVRRALVGHPGA